MSIRAWLGVATVLLWTGACAANQKGPAKTAPASGEMPVEITNNNWADVVVYAVHLGARYRLGTVTGMSQRVLEVPRSVNATADGISLLADPIGSDQIYQTQNIVTGPGDAIILVVESDLGISRYSVEARSRMLARHHQSP
jgi:hypothetical protein